MSAYKILSATYLVVLCSTDVYIRDQLGEAPIRFWALAALVYYQVGSIVFGGNPLTILPDLFELLATILVYDNYEHILQAETPFPVITFMLVEDMITARHYTLDVIDFVIHWSFVLFLPLWKWMVFSDELATFRTWMLYVTVFMLCMVTLFDPWFELLSMILKS